MPRKFFKKILPSEHAVRNDKNLRFLGKLLHDPNLWHLNRKSLSGAFAVGLFMAFVPFPFGQTPAAALLAIFFRVNLPLSALLVWLTNPLTMPPIYLMAIKLGSWVLGIHPELTQFEMSWSWVSANLITFWKPFVVGSLIFSVVGSILGFVLTRLLWRWYVTRKYLKKRRRYLQQKLEQRTHPTDGGHGPDRRAR